MAGPLANGSMNQRKPMSSISTITNLKRWSCQSQDLPSTAKIRALHVYDFDNTLFMSPLPNPKLWNSSTVGQLQQSDWFGSGGWWHDERILAATGQGLEVEEPRAWKGWWNEQVVELIKLSMEQDDTVAVLLTGRAENNFSQLIKRIVKSKDLSFDMICLKPETGPNSQRFSSTMNFKQAYLADLVCTYKDANELRIYEDRVKHTTSFREYFQKFNYDLQYLANAPRKPITTDVIQVTDTSTSLDPVVETAEVQRLINSHNTRIPPPLRNIEIKKAVAYTGYLISATDTAKLLSLVNNLPNMSSGNVRFLANNILVSHGQAQPTVISKAGGIGHQQDWQVTGLGVHQNSIWAVRVTPIPNTSAVYTDSNPPFIILAQKGSTPLAQANRINMWQPMPPDKQYIIQTTVGEKAQLRVEYESDENDSEGMFDRNQRKRLKRPHSPSVASFRQRGNDENKKSDFGKAGGNQNRGRGGGGAAGRGGSNHNNNSNRNSGRRGRGSGQNQGGGGGGGNRRGGGQRGYKSLDDVGTSNNRYPRGDPSYDDYVPPGTGGYNAVFPALGSGGDAGLPYGK